MLSCPLWPPEGGRVLGLNLGKNQMSPKEKHLVKVKGQVPTGWPVQGQRETGLSEARREEGKEAAGTGRTLDASLSFRDC